MKIFTKGMREVATESDGLDESNLKESVSEWRTWMRGYVQPGRYLQRYKVGG